MVGLPTTCIPLFLCLVIFCITPACIPADTVSFRCAGIPLCPSVCHFYHCNLCCSVSDSAARRMLLRGGAFGHAGPCITIMLRGASSGSSVVGQSAWNDLPFELRFFLVAYIIPWRTVVLAYI